MPLTVVPKPHECPERFCFNWVSPGGSHDVSGRVYESLEQALREGQFVVFATGGCLQSCSRSGGSTTDYYEPCEPELRRAGLPETYFDGVENVRGRRTTSRRSRAPDR